MASIYSDFAIKNPFLITGMLEGLAQNINAFNQASAGAITFSASSIIGHLEQSTFHKRTVGADADRDIAATGAGTPVKLTGDEVIGVKHNRRFGAVEYTRDSLVKQYGTNDEAVARRLLGMESGESQAQAALNQGINSAVAALIQLSMEEQQITGGLTLQKANTARAKMGDRLGNLRAAVMHSKSFVDLVGDALTDYKIDTVAGFSFVSGDVPGFLGMQVIFTDSTYLIDTTPTPDQYYTLLLQDAGIQLVLSESNPGLIEKHGDNIVRSYQVDYAVNITLRGVKWTGAVAPTSAALGTGANWTQAASSTKDLPGVVLKTQ